MCLVGLKPLSFLLWEQAFLGLYVHQVSVLGEGLYLLCLYLLHCLSIRPKGFIEGVREMTFRALTLQENTDFWGIDLDKRLHLFIPKELKKG